MKISIKSLLFAVCLISSIGSLVIAFAFYMQSQKIPTEIMVESSTEVINIETMQKQIRSLKRHVEALQAYDKENREFIVKLMKERNEIVFPRVDYYCPDTMVHAVVEGGTGAALLVNVCDQEKKIWD